MNRPHNSNLEWQEIPDNTKGPESVHHWATEFILKSWAYDVKKGVKFHTCLGEWRDTATGSIKKGLKRLPAEHERASISHQWNWEQVGRTGSEDTPHICCLTLSLFALWHSFNGHQAVVHCVLFVTLKTQQKCENVIVAIQVRLLGVTSLNTFRVGNAGVWHSTRCVKKGVSFAVHPSTITKGNKSALAVPTVK